MMLRVVAIVLGLSVSLGAWPHFGRGKKVKVDPVILAGEAWRYVGDWTQTEACKPDRPQFVMGDDTPTGPVKCKTVITSVDSVVCVTDAPPPAPSSNDYSNCLARLSQRTRSDAARPPN
jgi:hypothetical protein